MSEKRDAAWPCQFSSLMTRPEKSAKSCLCIANNGCNFFSTRGFIGFARNASGLFRERKLYFIHSLLMYHWVNIALESHAQKQYINNKCNNKITFQVNKIII